MREERAKYYYTAAGNDHYKVDYKGRRKVFYIPSGDHSEQAKRDLMAAGLRLARARILQLNEQDLKIQEREDQERQALSWRDENTPILNKIEDSNTASFRLIQDNTRLWICEHCSQYYDIDLDKQQAQQMVNELQQLVDLME